MQPATMPTVRSARERKSEGGEKARSPWARCARGARTAASPPCSSTPPAEDQQVPRGDESWPSGAATTMKASRNTACSIPASGAARAGPYVGRSARDGSGHADAAEQSRRDIGDPLCHELHVVAMFASRHAVLRNLGRQQAFHAAKQGERDCGGQQLQEPRGCDQRKRGQGQALRDTAKAAADRLDGQMQGCRNERSQGHGDQHGWPHRAPTPQDEDQRRATQPNGERGLD